MDSRGNSEAPENNTERRRFFKDATFWTQVYKWQSLAEKIARTACQKGASMN